MLSSYVNELSFIPRHNICVSLMEYHTSFSLKVFYINLDETILNSFPLFLEWKTYFFDAKVNAIKAANEPTISVWIRWKKPNSDRLQSGHKNQVENMN